MVVVTTDTIEGKPVKEYKGILTSEVIYSAQIFDEVSLQPKNVINGRLTNYEESLASVRQTALDEIVKKAEDMGCNAIIGLNFDYETMGKGTMIMVCLSGTGVLI